FRSATVPIPSVVRQQHVSVRWVCARFTPCVYPLSLMLGSSVSRNMAPKKGKKGGKKSAPAKKRNRILRETVAAADIPYNHTFTKLHLLATGQPEGVYDVKRGRTRQLRNTRA